VTDRILEITSESKGDRLDKLLAAHIPEVSRATLQRLIEEGCITVNGAGVKASYRTRPGDAIIARIPSEPPPAVTAEPIPLDIVYEDDDLLAINKPAGMVVHPALGHPGGTLVNALLWYAPDVEDDEQPDRPGIVHRLDRDTSGLILLAKTEDVRKALQEAFKERQVKKVYLALVEGHVSAVHGLITAALGRDVRHRKKIAVVPEGRESATEYRVLQQFDRYAYLQVEPHTGRTHQIRVHLAYIGYPVVGDTVYGFRKQRLSLDRQFLHAAGLSFRHPRTGQWLELSCPLPAELQRVLDNLRGGVG
jgi:23S rRNA pseudouridine1911/1915/1917 synthase